MMLGLRIDVCTYEGLRSGVPTLLRLLERYGLRASFFVTLGPDRSGRAIFQLFRPGFFAKMRRTRATQTYGWRTAMSGTLLPARDMGRLAPTIRQITGAAHEVALHGYDHRRWQDRVARMSASHVRGLLTAAIAEYEHIVGRRPAGFGAPGWQCTPTSLRLLEEFGFAYASDTRGGGPFFPCVDGGTLHTLQLPTTFPTLDEALGIDGMDGRGFVQLVRSLAGSVAWPVLVLHAEMEGGRYCDVAADLFSWFTSEGIAPMPLQDMAQHIQRLAGNIPRASIRDVSIPGRAGLVAAPNGLEPIRWRGGGAV